MAQLLYSFRSNIACSVKSCHFIADVGYIGIARVYCLGIDHLPFRVGLAEAVMDELKCLLVGVDFSPRSHTAAQMAVFLAKLTSASVEMMHVVETRITETDAQIMGIDKKEIEQAEINESKAELAALAEHLNYDNIRTRVVSGNAAESLTLRCREIGADILLVGDTGSMSLEARHALGVTAYRLVENGPEKVLVVKPSYHGVLDRIAAAVDFSPVSTEVMNQAIFIAKLIGARLSAVHAFSTAHIKRIRLIFRGGSLDDVMQSLREDTKKNLNEFLREFDNCGVSIEPVVLAGSVSSALLEYLQDEQIDMVVLGTGESLHIAGFPIGSTAHTIIEQTLASVLIVRAGGIT